MDVLSSWRPFPSHILRSLPNYVELDSDHRIMSTSIKVSLRTMKGKRCNCKTFYWKRLAEPQVKEDFQLKVANRFAVLAETETVTDTTNTDTTKLKG